MIEDENVQNPLFDGDMYGMSSWGDPYFTINPSGHVSVKVDPKSPSGDLYELVESLVKRGIKAPILIRFDNILCDRIRLIQDSFKSAIIEFDYKNTYCLTYPIKVNQQQTVVNLIQKTGNITPIGLEVGSKPELIAVLSILNTPGALLLCNGYKDAEYIEIALLATKIERRAIIIIEQYYELHLILDIAAKLNIEPEIGFRMRPFNKGAGRWNTSGGEMAKFGLTSDEIVRAMQLMKDAGKMHWIKLLHFHLGSQIPSISSIKKALSEASRMYTELALQCPEMSFIDVGGGLGVNYDGSRSSSDSSMDYTIDEYARDVVWAVIDACNNANIKHPTIITESGRAIVAHHSVLITEVIDVSPTVDPLDVISEPPNQDEVLTGIYELYQTVTPKNCHEVLHDAKELKELIFERFVHGSLNLNERAYAEQTYKHLIAKLRMLSKKNKDVPQEIEELDKNLLDIYFCNFSLFQSLPDSWAINQLFPVMPIHRLNEKPSRTGIIADLSCDSDGKIDRFVSNNGTEDFIPLHTLGKEPYYIGIFLVGAYQEILGGLHNLFGDTNAVHVELDDKGLWKIDHVIEGDTIRQVLGYVQYNPQVLIEQLRNGIEHSLKSGNLTTEESAKLQKKVKEALESYTYLVS